MFHAKASEQACLQRFISTSTYVELLSVTFVYKVAMQVSPQ